MPLAIHLKNTSWESDKVIFIKIFIRLTFKKKTLKR